MPKVMVFIDGTWLYANTPKLGEAYGGREFRVDYGKLPQVLAEAVSSQMRPQGGICDMDMVRTYLFGSYPNNYDPRDEDGVRSQLDFFDMLREEHHYEVEIYPVDFAGRRLRKMDRAPADLFQPQEKCVDISLATTMLYLAAVPQVYDIGIIVTGDRDFTPMLQHVRRLGKRVAVASIRGACSPSLADGRNETRVKDFDVIWLDDLLTRLEFRHERVQRPCEDPLHKGPRLVWTDYQPRKGQAFFCEECKRDYKRRREEQQAALPQSAAPQSGLVPTGPADISVALAPGVQIPNGASNGSPSNGSPSNGQASNGQMSSEQISNGHAPQTSQTSEASQNSQTSPDFYGREDAPESEEHSSFSLDSLPSTQLGFITTTMLDRGFGFIRAESGDEYFFHFTDLVPGVDFDMIPRGLQVEFEVKRRPVGTKAGAAMNVRLQAGAEMPVLPPNLF